jgi:hypothetical protein
MTTWWRFNISSVLNKEFTQNTDIQYSTYVLALKKWETIGENHHFTPSADRNATRHDAT